jgi:hypothetical protein
MAINHAWNIEKKRNKVLKKLLEEAKKNNDHNRITSLAADLAASNRKLSDLLKNE